MDTFIVKFWDRETTQEQLAIVNAISKSEAREKLCEYYLGSHSYECIESVIQIIDLREYLND